MIFDLGGLSSALTRQTNITTAKQAKERETLEAKNAATLSAAKKSADVTSRSVESAGKTRQEQLDVYSSMDETLRIAKEGMALSDSDNPLDRLQLWMLQQGDSRYTAEGNTRRLQYLQGASSALSEREVINQQAFADELTLIQSDLALATLADESELSMLTLAQAQGQELIDAHVNRTATLAGQLQNMNAMQEGVLLNLDPQQTAQAAQAAANNPSGTVNIGGIELTAGRLTARVDELKAREVTTLTSQATIMNYKLADLTLEQTQMKLAEAQNSKDGYADVGGVKISTARLTDRLQGLQSADISIRGQQMAMDESVKALADRNRDQYLQTLSIPELDQIAAGGGAIPALGGMQVPLNTLAAIRDQVAAFQTNAVQSQIAQQTMSDPVANAANLTQYVDSLKQFVPADSVALQTVFANARSVAAVAAKFAADGAKAQPGTPEFEGMLNSQQAVAASRSMVEDTINAEATRLSAGDKKREEALQFTLRGKQIPEAVIADAILERVQKGRPVTDWLSGPANGIFQATYAGILAGAMSDPALMMVSPTDRKTYAASQALEETKRFIGGELGSEMLQLQLDPTIGDPNHPLKPYLNASKLMSTMAIAEQGANQRFQEATGASNEDMQNWIKNGDNPELNQSQTAAFLIELEKIKPGLGQAYMDWWASPAQQSFTQRYTEAKTGAAAAEGFTKSSEISLVAPGLKADMQGYSMLLQDSQMRMVSNRLKEEHANFVTFGNDSRAKQAFLLEADKTLTPSQKSQAMQTIIQPLLDSAAAEGRNPQETAIVLEQALRSMRPEDPATRSLLSTILKNRDTSLSLVDNFIEAQNLAQVQSPWGVIAERAKVTIMGDPVQQAARGYEWLNQ